MTSDVGHTVRSNGFGRAICDVRLSVPNKVHKVALRATARQVISGAANVQAHSDRRAETTAEAAKYDAFGPNHGGAFCPFDCGRTALVG